MKRTAPLAMALLAAGCGASAPPSDMPARSWKYYAAHPDEIAPMQAICRQWAASGASVGTEPAVVAGNCRAAAFTKSMLDQRDRRTR